MDKAEQYRAMIRELVESGVIEFDSVEPSLAETIAWAKFGLYDDAADILCQAEDWHIDARVAALQHGQFEEANRLLVDGMRIVMGSRYDVNSHKFVAGPVQIDIDAEIERQAFDRKMGGNDGR